MQKVLSGYSLDVVKGEILELVGQSGCGAHLARIMGSPYLMAEA